MALKLKIVPSSEIIIDVSASIAIIDTDETYSSYDSVDVIDGKILAGRSANGIVTADVDTATGILSNITSRSPGVTSERVYIAKLGSDYYTYSYDFNGGAVASAKWGTWSFHSNSITNGGVASMIQYGNFLVIGQRGRVSVWEIVGETDGSLAFKDDITTGFQSSSNYILGIGANDNYIVASEYNFFGAGNDNHLHCFSVDGAGNITRNFSSDIGNYDDAAEIDVTNSPDGGDGRVFWTSGINFRSYDISIGGNTLILLKSWATSLSDPFSDVAATDEYFITIGSNNSTGKLKLYENDSLANFPLLDEIGPAYGSERWCSGMNGKNIVFIDDEGGSDPSILTSILITDTSTIISGGSPNNLKIVSSFPGGNLLISPPVIPIPDAPILNLPLDGSILGTTDPSLSWYEALGADSYWVQVDDISTFASPTYDVSGITDLFYNVSNLDTSTAFYWRVAATNTSGTGDWSEKRNFIVPEFDVSIVLTEVEWLSLGNVTINYVQTDGSNAIVTTADSSIIVYSVDSSGNLTWESDVDESFNIVQHQIVNSTNDLFFGTQQLGNQLVSYELSGGSLSNRKVTTIPSPGTQLYSIQQHNGYIVAGARNTGTVYVYDYTSDGSLIYVDKESTYPQSTAGLIHSMTSDASWIFGCEYNTSNQTAYIHTFLIGNEGSISYEHSVSWADPGNYPDIYAHNGYLYSGSRAHWYRIYTINSNGSLSLTKDVSAVLTESWGPVVANDKYVMFVDDNAKLLLNEPTSWPIEASLGTHNYDGIYCLSEANNIYMGIATNEIPDRLFTIKLSEIQV